MSDPADLARGWFRKGDRDLFSARLVAAVNPAPDLAGCDLTQLTPYAVQLRYDSSFWPDQSTAHEAIDLAEQVRTAVPAVVPPAAHP